MQTDWFHSFDDMRQTLQRYVALYNR